MVQRQVASAGAPPHRLHKSTQSTHVPGQLIIRFKPGAVRQMAANPVARSASARLVARAMPEEVAGPLDLLRDQAGLSSVKPLFVTGTRPQAPASAVMARAVIHGALARSATHSPRETLTGYQLVDLKDKKITPALLKRLRASKAVDLVEPVPNRWLCDADPKINRQWGLRAIRWFNGTHPDAAEVHVAVIDSGIDEGHPDLKDAIEEYRHDGNGARDFLGHGSHVGGTIAAVVDNTIGIAGIANCRLHCWKVFNDPTPVRKLQNFNFHFYSMALAAALDSDIKVINMSIGGTDRSKAEAAVFEELREAGVVVAAAMGNEFEEGNPKEYPAGYPGPLGVGAVDEFGKHASFSNTGAHIGLVAPGVNILSTVPRVKAADADRTNYDSWDGTSMATPHVAGAAALLYANRGKSKASGDAVIERLTSTARKLPGMRKKKFTPQYGAGLLDIEAALKNAGKNPKRS
ncbi:S8 family serine peptidase [Bradyrhizobium sp.]|uniref:S8 family serine peptidase n=1 Tax=Bradyrhizobium sp. TaxID=376 RepID=UPI002DFDCFA8|nr:S8 family serine peptidase [Bradyrhizobium sp.]